MNKLPHLSYFTGDIFSGIDPSRQHETPPEDKLSEPPERFLSTSGKPFFCRFTDVFNTCGLLFRYSEQASRRVGSKRRHQGRTHWHHDGCHNMVLDGVDGDLAGSDGIRSVTHTGPRRVEACLGGHDDGASGVDKGLKRHRFSFENGDDRHGRNYAYSAISDIQNRGPYLSRRFQSINLRFSQRYICIHRPGRRHVPMTTALILITRCFDRWRRGVQTGADGGVDCECLRWPLWCQVVPNMPSTTTVLVVF